MTDKSGHNGTSEPDRRDLFEQFPADQRDRIRELWDASARAAPGLPGITEDEVEDAMSDVHRRIGINKSSPDNENSSPDRSNKLRWILAAAVVLLIFGAGILMIPRTVNAPNGEITSVTLPDGSSVELNSGSRIRYNRLYSFTNRTVSLDGEAFFEVRNGNHPFIVNAHNSGIEVTGTKFNIRSWSENPEEETEVTVSEGAVQFYPECCRDHSVTVTQGQLSKWNAGMEKPSPPESVSVDRITGWRDRKLIFNDKTLLVIFRELERRFDTDIQLENAGIGRETLTTYYAEPKRNAESVIRDICRVKGLRYAKTANGFRVYR